MSRTRWVGGIAASAVAVGTMVVGGGTAFADTGTPTPAPEAGSNQKICTERIPKLLAKIDKVTTKINGDASVKGSTAWLQAKETEARNSGRTALADLIQARVSNRPHRLTDLATVKGEIEAVQKKDCAP